MGRQGGVYPGLPVRLAPAEKGGQATGHILTLCLVVGQKQQQGALGSGWVLWDLFTEPSVLLAGVGVGAGRGLAGQKEAHFLP